MSLKFAHAATNKTSLCFTLMYVLFLFLHFASLSAPVSIVHDSFSMSPSPSLPLFCPPLKLAFRARPVQPSPRRSNCSQFPSTVRLHGDIKCSSRTQNQTCWYSFSTAFILCISGTCLLFSFLLQFYLYLLCFKGYFFTRLLFVLLFVSFVCVSMQMQNL